MSVRSKPNREGEAPAEPERDESELPEGWAMPLLGEVATIKQGNSKLTKKTYKPDGKYVAFSGSGPDGLVDEFEFEGDAIVLSAVGARCGKCFRASGQWTAIANTAVIRTRIDDPTLLEYLFLLVNDENFWPKGGTAQPFVQTGQAQRETRIPLAPLAEQRRIVGKLELLLGKVSSSQQRLSRVPCLLKRFRQSVLAAACSGKLTADWREENHVAEAEWMQSRADEVCEAVQSGLTPKAELFQTDNGVPFLKVYNIVNQAISFEYRPQFVSEETHRTTLKRACALPGDVLMNIVGPPLGKVAIVPDDYPRWSINQAIVLFRPNSQLDRRFLYLVLCSGIPYAEILSETRGSAGQSNISLSQCREMLLPIPPLAEQQEIVRRVEKLFAFADQIEARLKLAQTHVDRITQSLLAKAFRGELVPTEHALATAAGRDYEPADELLVRIRATQASASPAKPKRGKTSKT